MKLIKIEDKKRLNDFISSQKHSQFLQSWEWGDFQEREGFGVARLGAEDGGRLVAAATLTTVGLFAGKKYFYCPRGPVFDENNGETAVECLLAGIKEMAEKENAIFLRMEPAAAIQNLIPPERNKIQKTIDIQPTKTLVLDLDKSEKDLLAGMSQKTRYNIRLAEKKSVIAREGRKEEADIFWKLMSATVKRDGFRPHSKGHYEKMLSAGNKGGLRAKLFLAEHSGQTLAAVIAVFFGDTAVYAHGASSNKDRNLMAPHLLQWRIILSAKAAGLKYYDFHGIDEKKWPGVTRFKRGFGGYELAYPGTFDLVFNPVWYEAYKIIRKARRMF